MARHIGWHLPSALNDGFRHEALFYSSDAEFIAGTLPFVSEGCEAGEPVLVAARRERLDLLRLALGSHGHAKSVTFLEFDELGLNPARIIPAWRQFYDECGGANRPIRGIGEPVWADRSRAEVEECRRHEALLNLAFADAEGFWLRCPYDRSTSRPRGGSRRVLHPPGGLRVRSQPRQRVLSCGGCPVAVRGRVVPSGTRQRGSSASQPPT